MNNPLKHIISEKFKSKKQQRYFYAQCNDENLSKKERRKWCKMAKEFADDTNFKKLPEKAPKEVADKELEEIVDFDGSMMTSKIPKDVNTKNVTSKKDSEMQVKATSQPPFQNGQYMRRYWGEAEMDDALGYEETMGQNKPYEEALEYFMDELEFDEPEAKERLEKLGYIPNSEDKVRIVEKMMTKGQIEEYVDQILSKRTKMNDVIETDEEYDFDELDTKSFLDRKVKYLKDLSDKEKEYIIKKLQEK